MMTAMKSYLAATDFPDKIKCELCKRSIKPGNSVLQLTKNGQPARLMPWEEHGSVFDGSRFYPASSMKHKTIDNVQIYWHKECLQDQLDSAPYSDVECKSQKKKAQDTLRKMMAQDT